MNGDWRIYAACRGNPEIFFGPDDEDAVTHYRRTEEARRICRGCPVRTPCLEGALKRGERWGVWGAQNFEHRLMCRNKLHVMDGANTWTDRFGHRNCRECRNAADQRSRARKQEVAA